MLLPLFLTLSTAQVPAQPTQSNQQASTNCKETIQPVHLKVLPADAWEAPKEPKFPAYPPLAHAAGIHGDMLVLLILGEDGKVLKATAIKGPPQLRLVAESYLRHLEYKVKPGNGPAPWAISITMRFDLRQGTGFAATGQEIALQKVPVGTFNFAK